MIRKAKLAAAVAVLLVAALAGGWALNSNKAPAVRLAQLDGGQFDLAECDAQVVVLEFWSAGCTLCRKTLPMVEAVHEWAEAEGKSVAFYAVNFRDAPEDAAKAKADVGFELPVVLDRDGKVTEAYNVKSFPTIAIIRDGRIRHLRVGFNPNLTPELKDELSSLLEPS